MSPRRCSRRGERMETGGYELGYGASAAGRGCFGAPPAVGYAVEGFCAGKAPVHSAFAPVCLGLCTVFLPPHPRPPGLTGG